MERPVSRVGAAVVFDAYVEVGKVDDAHGLPGVGGLDGFLVAWEGGSRSMFHKSDLSENWAFWIPAFVERMNLGAIFHALPR